MKYNPTIAVAYFVAAGLPEPEIEYHFALPRLWRFDFAWPLVTQANRNKEWGGGVALEVEGAIFQRGGGGRHNRGAGMKADLEKYNEAAARGWLIIRVMPEQLMRESTIQLIRRALR